MAEIGLGPVCDRVTARMLGEADPHRDGATGAVLGAQPAGDAIGEVPEHRADQLGRDVAAPERRLRADRSRSPVRLHPTVIVVGRERADLSAERPAEQRLQRAVGRRCQLADRVDAAVGESLRE